MKHVDEARSSVINAIEVVHQDFDCKIRVKFKNSNLWYEKQVSNSVGEEAYFRFTVADTGSFGKWARSVKLFFDMKVGSQD